MKNRNLYNEATRQIFSYIIFMFSFPVIALLLSSVVNHQVIILGIFLIWCAFAYRQYLLKCPKCETNVFKGKYLYSPIPRKKCVKCNFDHTATYTKEEFEQFIQTAKNEKALLKVSKSEKDFLYALIFMVLSVIVILVLNYFDKR